MSVPQNAASDPKDPPAPPKAKGMTDEERRIFERSFKRNEAALRRLAKL